MPTPEPNASRIRVAVLHPHALIAVGVIHTLAQEPDIEAAPWAECRQQRHDVVITDQETALALVRGGAAWHPLGGAQRLLVMAPAARESEVRAALEAGIHGYLLYQCRPAELAQAVRVVAAGARHLGEGVLRCVAESLAHERLTARELMVLEQLGQGHGNKTIANRLGIAVGTTKSHVKAILEKLGASNRTQAVAVAVARGLLPEQRAEARPAPPARRWSAAALRLA